mgnify:CR=1 FL=1
MKKFYFLFVGYNTIEETKLCRFLTAFHLPFHYAAVQNVAEAQSFLLEHKVDFIISHPQTTEFMNFIDLIKQNTAIGIIKPFFATDLLSRSKLENRDIDGPHGTIYHEIGAVRYAGLEIYPASRCVIVCGQQISLTPTEYDIFLLLASSPKRVFTYEIITDIIWHENYSFYSRKVISNHISNIKKKIRTITNAHQYIVSVHGIGYKFILE